MGQKRRLSLLSESRIFGSLGLPTSLSKRKWFLLILRYILCSLFDCWIVVHIIDWLYSLHISGWSNSCCLNHLKSWKANLKENSTYVMHNFKVFKDVGQFRVCKHEYKLFFIGVTVVREADLHELPFKLDLLNLQMSLLAILWLACWLVSVITICAFILIITSLVFFQWPVFISGGLRYYWGCWSGGLSACFIKKYQGCF